jgi:hypothetical protein
MPSHRLLAAAALALAATVSATTPAHAGPPWISIELPANPMNTTTRGAYLLVHSFHHDIALRQVLEGRAEGIVDGRRQTIPLTFTDTSRDFVRALQKNWPDKGTWVLVITTGGHPDGATALVGIGSDGAVRSVDVPTTKQGRWVVPRAVSQADVNAMLTRLASSEANNDAHRNLALALGGLLVLPVGVMALRRRS